MFVLTQKNVPHLEFPDFFVFGVWTSERQVRSVASFLALLMINGSFFIGLFSQLFIEEPFLFDGVHKFRIEIIMDDCVYCLDKCL